MSKLSRTFCGVVAVAALGGCATRYGPESLQAGVPMSEVTSVLGAPSGRYAHDGGARVEYARGPYGRHTYMLDFDAQGRLTGWQQVLSEPVFNDIRVGMTREQLLATIGHPASSQELAHQKRALWSYRYETPFCKLFQVGIDRQDRVVDTGYGPDPMCDVNLSDR